jgi:hypothetical protein
MTLEQFEARIGGLNYHVAKGRTRDDEPLYAIAVFRPGDTDEPIAGDEGDDLQYLLHRTLVELVSKGEIT